MIKKGAANATKQVQVGAAKWDRPVVGRCNKSDKIGVSRCGKRGKAGTDQVKIGVARQQNRCKWVQQSVAE